MADYTMGFCLPGEECPVLDHGWNFDINQIQYYHLTDHHLLFNKLLGKNDLYGFWEYATENDTLVTKSNDPVPENSTGSSTLIDLSTGGYQRTSSAYGVSGVPGLVIGGNGGNSPPIINERTVVILEDSEDNLSSNNSDGIVVTGTSQVIDLTVRDRQGNILTFEHEYVPGTLITLDRPPSLAFDPSESANFGICVGIDTDTGWAVSGAPGFSNGTGGAYVYKREGSSWEPFQDLLTVDITTGDNYGAIVGVCGNTIIVVAPAKADNDSIFIWEYNESTLEFEHVDTLQRPFYSDIHYMPYGQFKCSSDKTLFMINDRREAAIYVYEKSGGVWGLRGAIIGDDLYGWGTSVDMSPDGIWIVTGEPNRTYGINYGGRISLYKWNGSIYAIHTVLNLTGIPAYSWFHNGTQVALSNDSLISHAPDAQYGPLYNQYGAIYAWDLVDDEWTNQQIVWSEAYIDTWQILYDPGHSSLSIYGDKFISGFRDDDDDYSFARVYEKQGGSWEPINDVIFPSPSYPWEVGVGDALYLSGPDLIAGGYIGDDTYTDTGHGYITNISGSSTSYIQRFALDEDTHIDIGSLIIDPGSFITATGVTIAFVDGGSGQDYLEDTTGNTNFLALGFVAGDRLSVTGATSVGNDLNGVIIRKVTATRVYFDTGTISSEEYINSGTLISTNGMGTGVQIDLSGDNFSYVVGTEVKASIVGTVADTFVITLDVNDQFSYTIDGGAVNTVIIPPDTYTTATLASTLNGLVSGITFSDDGNGHIQIDRNVEGAIHKFAIVTVADDCYTAIGLTEAVYVGTGGLEASKTLGTVVDNFVITLDVNDQFRYSINGGATNTVTISAGTYTAQELSDELNSLVSGITFSDDGNGHIQIDRDAGGLENKFEIITVADDCYTAIGLTEGEYDNGIGSEDYSTYSSNPPDLLYRRTGSFITDGFVAGDRITTTNSPTSGNDLIGAIILEVTENTLIFTHGTLSKTENFSVDTGASSNVDMDSEFSLLGVVIVAGGKYLLRRNAFSEMHTDDVVIRQHHFLEIT